MIIRSSPTGGNFFVALKSFDVNIAISCKFVLNAINSSNEVTIVTIDHRFVKPSGRYISRFRLYFYTKKLNQRNPLSSAFSSTFSSTCPNKNAFQLNANHPLADSMGYIKLEGKKIFLL